ncbi:MAG: flagellar hook-basal body protein [Ignavibacteria bacterium]|jgi:flagellar basal-body rod protein FlgG|nr:flagellar hook-basal body protein [Ignavibacteria bacterium]
MIKDLHTAALAMMNSQTRLEVTANNIANVNTTAFKKEAVFERNLVDAKASLFNNPHEIEQNDPPIGSYLDWRVGDYTQTANPLDVSIEGAGFFVTKNADGDKSLTRSGSFGLNSNGFLTTKDGRYIVGTDEDAIHVPDFAVINDGENPNERQAVNIVIANTGELYANDVMIGKLLVVDCDDYSQLERIDKQSFLPLNNVGVRQIDDDVLRLKQGYLENSNVDIISEMVNMIELQRAFETGSKVIQTNDTLLDRSIQTARFGQY